MILAFVLGVLFDILLCPTSYSQQAVCSPPTLLCRTECQLIIRNVPPLQEEVDSMLDQQLGSRLGHHYFLGCWG